MLIYWQIRSASLHTDQAKNGYNTVCIISNNFDNGLFTSNYYDGDNTDSNLTNNSTKSIKRNLKTVVSREKQVFDNHHFEVILCTTTFK